MPSCQAGLAHFPCNAGPPGQPWRNVEYWATMTGSTPELSSRLMDVALTAWFVRPGLEMPTLWAAVLRMAPKMFQPIGFAAYQMGFSALLWQFTFKKKGLSAWPMRAGLLLINCSKIIEDNGGSHLTKPWGQRPVCCHPPFWFWLLAH